MIQTQVNLVQTVKPKVIWNNYSKPPLTPITSKKDPVRPFPKWRLLLYLLQCIFWTSIGLFPITSLSITIGALSVR